MKKPRAVFELGQSSASVSPTEQSSLLDVTGGPSAAKAVACWETPAMEGKLETRTLLFASCQQLSRVEGQPSAAGRGEEMAVAKQIKRTGRPCWYE